MTNLTVSLQRPGGTPPSRQPPTPTTHDDGNNIAGFTDFIGPTDPFEITNGGGFFEIEVVTHELGTVIIESETPGSPGHFRPLFCLNPLRLGEITVSCNLAANRYRFNNIGLAVASATING